MTFVSPGLIEALNSAETEAQARGRISMLHVIQRGVERKEYLPCPWCASPPPLAAKVCGRFIIECESEECSNAGREIRCVSDTLDGAWKSWNARI